MEKDIAVLIRNRKDVAASRARDLEKGIVRVEVRIPKGRRGELLALAAKWREEVK